MRVNDPVKNHKTGVPRSGMPLMAAVKIGCSNFKSHPIRLFITILLSMIAFSFLGVALDPVVEDRSSIAYHTMENNGIEEGVVFKRAVVAENGAIDYVNFTDDDIKEVEKYANEALPLATFSGIDNLYSKPTDPYYNLPWLKSRITEEQMQKFGFEIDGSLPDKDELAITKYTAEVFEHCVFIRDGYLHESYSASELIGKEIVIDKKAYTISGIIDTHFDDKKYSSLKESYNDNNLFEKYHSEIKFGSHNLLFMGDEISLPQTLRSPKSDLGLDVPITAAAVPDTEDKLCTFWDEDGIYIPADYFRSPSMLQFDSYYEMQKYFAQWYFGKNCEDMSTLLAKYWDVHKEELYDTACKNGYIGSLEDYETFLFRSPDISFENPYGISGNEILFEVICENKDFFAGKEPKTLYISNDVTKRSFPVKVKGAFLSEKPYNGIRILADGSVCDSMEAQYSGNYEYLIVDRKMITKENFKHFLLDYDDKPSENAAAYQFNNYVTNSLYFLNGKMDPVLKVMAPCLACAFAVFAALSLCFFMINSVTERENTVLLLDSLATSRSGIAKIFISEALILGALICVATFMGYALLMWALGLYFGSIKDIYIAGFGVDPLVSLILVCAVAALIAIGCVCAVKRLNNILSDHQSNADADR